MARRRLVAPFIRQLAGDRLGLGRSARSGRSERLAPRTRTPTGWCSRSAHTAPLVAPRRSTSRAIWRFFFVADLRRVHCSRMRGVHVDAARRPCASRAARWGDVDHAAAPFGLAVPSGFVSSTGVGGLTLGGGIGYLSRASGLTIDNLLSADMVLADGSVARRAPTRTPICSGRCAAAAATSAW